MLPRTIDPITFEVVRNALDSLVDEMALTIMRTAHSGIVKDAMDYSTAFCDRNGQVLAQGLTITLHLGSFPDVFESVMNKFRGSIEPGDIFIVNDPYGSGGIHLPDIYVIKPVFVDGIIEGFSGAVAHHTDVGGLVPGSNSTDSTEIYQEGLRIPTLKLYERGIPNRTMFEIIEKNVRLPKQVLGDMSAQIAAVNIGEREYLVLVERYGAITLRQYTDTLLDYTEQLAREDILALPDGSYQFTDYIDADNIEDGPVVINVELTVRGDRIFVDLSGSTPQVRAGINSPLPFSKAGVFGAIRLVLDPGIPNSVGLNRLVEVSAPEGTVVNPVLPAACGARGITGFRVMDAVTGALAQAAPDRVPADGDGGNSMVTIGGYDEDLQPFAYVDLIAGARGGRPIGDGPEGVPHPGANISNTSVEIAEVELPILVEEYGIKQDTGGPGKYRGALSQVRSVRCLAEEATLQLRSDKRKFPPYGLQGGKPGNPSWNILKSQGQETILPTMGARRIAKDDVVSHIIAGGGGWGDPLERDPTLVQQDVWNEKLSVDYVRREYGVVIDPDSLQIDYEATSKLRKGLRASL